MRSKLLLAVSLLAALCLTLAAKNVLTIQKTTAEIFDLGVNFTPVIGPCDNEGVCAGSNGITLISVTAVNTATSLDATSLIIASSPAPGVVGSTDFVSFRVQAGVPLQTYAISVKVHDAVTGDLYEGTVTLKILPPF